jgi:hypothetical protein
VGNGRKRLALAEAETLACLLVFEPDVVDSETAAPRARHEEGTPLASQKDSPKFDWVHGPLWAPDHIQQHALSLDGKSERVPADAAG